MVTSRYRLSATKNFNAKYLHKRPKRPNILIITYVLPEKKENIHYFSQYAAVNVMKTRFDREKCQHGQNWP